VSADSWTFRDLNHLSEIWYSVFCWPNLRAFVVDRLCYSAKGLITVSGFCKPSDADADDIELWLPVSNSERTLTVDTAKYVVSLLSDCFTQLLDDENKASALDARHGISLQSIFVSLSTLEFFLHIYVVVFCLFHLSILECL